MRNRVFKPAGQMFAALGCLVLASITGACASSSTSAATTANETVAPSSAAAPLIYELRTYTPHPNKLDDLHSRFRNHTMRLFEKHGIKNIAYWTTLPNTESGDAEVLVYIVAHKSRAEAALAWKAFVEDPDWRAVYAESQANGPLVANIESVFLTATNYSPRINSNAKF